MAKRYPEQLRTKLAGLTISGPGKGCSDPVGAFTVWELEVEDGTQEIFYQDATVAYYSIHGDPNFDYPFFWGTQGEVGEAAGKGHNHNWPLPLGSSEKTFLAALDESLTAIAAFDPAFLVLSLGFDFMEDDPVPLGGGFRVGQSGLIASARRIASLSRPTVIVQEGGYRIDKLGGYVVTFLQNFSQ